MSYIVYNTYNGETQLSDIIDVEGKRTIQISNISYFMDELRSLLASKTTGIDPYLGTRYISDETLDKISGGSYRTTGAVSIVQRYVPTERGTKRTANMAFAASIISPKDLRENFMNEVFGFCPAGVTSYTIFNSLKTPENLWSKERVSEVVNKEDANMIVNIVVELIKTSDSRTPNGNLVVKVPGGDAAACDLEMLREIYSIIPPIYRTKINFSANGEVKYSGTRVSERMVNLDRLTNIMVVSENSTIESMPGFDKKVIHSTDITERTPDTEWLYRWIEMLPEERKKLCEEFKLGEKCSDVKSLFLSVAQALMLKDQIKELSSGEQKKLFELLNTRDEDMQKVGEASITLKKLKKDQRSNKESAERYRMVEELRKKALKLYESGDYETLSQMNLDKLEFNISFKFKQLIQLNKELSNIKGKVSLFHMKEKKQQIEDKQKEIESKKKETEKVLKGSFKEYIENCEAKSENSSKRIPVIEEKISILKKKISLDIVSLYDLLKLRPELLELVGELKRIDFNSIRTDIQKEEIVVIEDGKSM